MAENQREGSRFQILFAKNGEYFVHGVSSRFGGFNDTFELCVSRRRLRLQICVWRRAATNGSGSFKLARKRELKEFRRFFFDERFFFFGQPGDGDRGVFRASAFHIDPIDPCIHYFSTFIAFIIANFILDWFEWEVFGIVVAIMTVLYFIIWLIQYRRYKSEIKRINDELETELLLRDDKGKGERD